MLSALNHGTTEGGRVVRDMGNKSDRPGGEGSSPRSLTQPCQSATTVLHWAVPHSDHCRGCFGAITVLWFSGRRNDLADANRCTIYGVADQCTTMRQGWICVSASGNAAGAPSVQRSFSGAPRGCQISGTQERENRGPQ
jgi:hypothetical protein